MKNKTMRFLNVSLALVSLFCILIFSIQSICMNMMGADAIKNLGIIYMGGMSEQVASHFGTTIELRLSQVESLVDAVPPGRYAVGTPMQIELTYNARSAGFEYLALYTSDGNFHMLYGSQITADIPEALHRSVQGGKYNVCAGTDAAGTPIVLMGVPAVYPMNDGESSIGLVAGLPTSYLSDTLEGNIKNSMVDYSIIRNDGSYVLQNKMIEEDNYFERIEKHYETYNGKEPEQYEKELKDSLDHNVDYTSEVIISGERWNVYCTNLPNSEWHLLLKISHNTLDETVNVLQRRWTFVSIGGCSLIIGALLLVFLGYFHLTRKQLHELNEARKSAERSNKAKNEFLSNMSHDIRTPMNGIMGMTSIAINSLDNPPRVRSCLKKINVSSRHLLGLINDMLDMSKIENGKFTLNMEPLSLRDVMQNVMTIIQPQIHEKNQQFNIYIYDIYHENVCSDRVRLSQILLNIVGNAVKFTPDNGIIEISLTEEPSPKGDRYIRSCLHVKDNGIGISKEFMNKIFDAFTREDNARVDKAAGAGMGMAIAKYIVDEMGGTISVESEQGKGSDFYVTLDMEIALQQEQDMHLSKREVLVVDDDKTANDIAVASLEFIGLHAESALDIDQAFQMIEGRHNRGEDYHIILLDWDIQGQDGIQTVKKLRECFGVKVIIVMLSDGDWDELEIKGRDAGISSFIAKPLFHSALYYGLRQYTEIEESEEQEQETEEAKEQEETKTEESSKQTEEKHQEKEQAEEEEEEIEEENLIGRHILVAEDNETNWSIVDIVLSAFGMELDWAENGQLCVEKFEQSDIGWYDAILMDLRMPIMTGYEAAVAIRKLGREDASEIPIIAVSADTFPDDIQKCLDCGMNAHTAKPFDVQKVTSLLNQYMH